MANGMGETSDRRGALDRLVGAFVDAHPGTRRGHLFGRPAVYAGARAFAEITGRGLACRVGRRAIRERRLLQTPLFRPDPRPAWVVVSKQHLRTEDLARVTTVLELAAADAVARQLEDSP